jgi:hypothetical protein
LDVGKKTNLVPYFLLVLLDFLSFDLVPLVFLTVVSDCLSALLHHVLGLVEEMAAGSVSA